MATNPLIAQGIQVPDIGATFSNALLNVAAVDRLKEQRAQQDMRNRLLEAKTLTAEAGAPSQQGRFNRRDIERIQSISQAALQLKSIPSRQERLNFALRRREQLKAQGIDTNETDMFIGMLASGDDVDPILDKTIKAGQMVGVLKPQTAVTGGATLQKGATFRVETDQGPAIATNVFDPVSGRQRIEITPFGEGARFISDLGETAEEQTQRKIREAGGRAAAEKSVELKTAGPIAAAGESGKIKAQIKLKPQLEAAVEKARKKAQEEGTVFTELEQMKAALPGLQETVSSLRELANVATYTTTGRLFDLAVKELGFGSTKGATARAKFESIVNNQILPLLKPTFGAQFTVQEGEELRKTLGDINETPEQKTARLDAFITQKVRDIETKSRQLGQESPVNRKGWKLMQDANGNKAYVGPNGEVEEVK